MPREIKVMSDVVAEPNGAVRSDMIDNESTRPKFLSRKRTIDEYGEIGATQSARKNKKLLWWVLGVIIVIVILFFVLGSFARATIVVTPRSEEVTLNSDEVIFYRSDTGELHPGFKLIQVRDEASRELTSIGTKHIERKASGTIIVFNEYSQTSLKLIKNTRFQTPAGKIFRTPVAVTIPGTHLEGGKTVAGSLDVEVFADEPGILYNVGLVDLTIPGLQGDPSYSKVYARAKTPLDGGYTGEAPVVSDSDKTKTEAELESELRDKLFDKLSSETPGGYVLVPNIGTVNSGELEASYNQTNRTASGSTAVFKKKGSLSSIIISEIELARAIASIKVSGYNDEGVHLNGQMVTFTTRDQKFDPIKSSTVKLTLGGTTSIIWDYSVDDLKKALVGQKKSDYKDIFRQFPMIKNAEIKILPVWKGRFPEDTEKIKIETTN